MKRATLVIWLLFAAFISIAIALDIPKGSITGKVIDRYGRPIAGTFVTLYKDSFYRTIKTTKNGTFHFNDIPVNGYSLRTKAVGYSGESYPTQVDVKEGRITHLKAILLQPVTPYFYANLNKRGWYPGESISVSLRGAIQSPKVKFKLGKVPMSVIDKVKGDMDSLDREIEKRKKWDNEITFLKSWETTLSETDDWGSYDELVSFKAAEPGIYLLDIKAGSFSQRLTFAVTKIAIISKHSPLEIFLLSVDSKTGEPVEGVNLTIMPQTGQSIIGTSDKNGLFSTDLKRQQGEFYIKGIKGNSVTFLVSSNEWESGKNLIYFYTDRPVYRPGHTIAFKGIVKQETGLKLAIPVNKEVQVSIQDPEGTQVYQKRLKTNRFGSFNSSFTLPENTRVGEYQVNTTIDSSSYFATISVESYRKPEYKIEFSANKRYTQGETVPVVIKAGYFFGAPTQGAKVEYTVYKNIYWYWSGDFYEEFFDEDLWFNTYYRYGEIVLTGEGKTNNDGTFQFQLPCPREEQDSSYTAEAHITDLSGKTVVATHSFLATREEFMLSVKQNRYWYLPGDKINMEITAANFDGKVIKKLPVDIILEKVEWNSGQSKETFSTIQTFTQITDENGKSLFTFTPPHDGRFRLKVKAQKTWASAYFLVGKTSWLGGRGKNEGIVTLVTDKKMYKVGEEANILVSSSDSPKTLLLTVEGGKLHKKEILDLSHGPAAFSLPITNEYMPSITIAASYIKNGEITTDSRTLYVDPRQQFLNIEISSNKVKYLPGEKADFNVKTTDLSGKPVSAELSFGTVDEAIYAIKGESAPDIRKFFYGKRSNLVTTSVSFTHGYWGGLEKELGVEEIRRNFKDTAHWIPNVITDKKGEAAVTFPFPDNLTAWRTTVRGNTLNNLVGDKVQWVNVSKELLIRLELPRFFMQNDRATINAVVHNLTGKDQNIEVRINAQGVDLPNAKHQTISVKDGGMGQVKWDINAPNTGTATIAASCFIAGQSRKETSDAMELSIPVYPHGLKDTIAKSGEVQEKENFEIHFNADNYIKGSSTLTVTLAPSIASSLFNILSYLENFQYSSAEGLMDVILPNVVVVEALRALGIKEPKLEKEIPVIVAKNLKTVYGWQHENGMWGWGTYDRDNFMTAYVVYGLYHTRKAGFAINNDSFQKGIKALLRETPQEKNLDIKATMLYVLSFLNSEKPLHGNNVLNKELDNLVPYLPKLQSYSTALLAIAFNNIGQKKDAGLAITYLKNKVKVTEFTAFWEEIFPWGFYSCNNYETTGYALKALIAVTPKDPLIPKAARWLLLSRQGSRWAANYDTASVVYALADYITRYQELNPEYTAKLSLNGKLLREIKITKDDIYKSEISLTLKEEELKNGANIINMEKEGKGNLYYTTLLSGFKRGEQFPSQSNGVTVKREYFRLKPHKSPKDESIIYETIPFDGKAKAGEILQVKLTINGAQNGAHLVVEDWIPSGFEVITRPDKQWNYWWSGEQRMDNKMIFLLRYFYAKEQHLTYEIRAEVPGIFHVLPAKASGMYIPEINGMSAENIIEVVNE